MRPRGGYNEHCLSRGLELRLRKADRATGRQGDRREVEVGRDDYDDEVVLEGDEED